MKATLKSTVELWQITVSAELAVWEPRPDLQRLCHAVAQSGELELNTVAKLLPGLSDRAMDNLIRYVKNVQLIDRNGRLTTFGRNCASHGTAPAWEQGVYDLLVGVHPLFGACILEFQRASGQSFDRDYDSLEPVPSWLKPSSHRIFTSAFEHQRSFSLTAFPSARGQTPQCRSRPLKAAQLHWEIELDSGENEWWVEGTVGRGKNTEVFQSASSSLPADELIGIYAGWEPNWNARSGRVSVPYDHGVMLGGRETFQRSRKYARLPSTKYGDFEDVVVQNVPVEPATTVDAKSWAAAIAVERVKARNGYVSLDVWDSLWEEIVSEEPLSRFQIQAPSPKSIRSIGREPVPDRVQWLFSAAVDLGVS